MGSSQSIVYTDSLIANKVNGNEVLRYSKPQLGWAVTRGYNLALKVDGKALESAYIGLQAEGQAVIFKDIKIKELKP